MHYRQTEDAQGDLIDLVPFCCDSCHQAWCAHYGEAYDGWNGCQEEADYPQWCAMCGVRCALGTEEPCVVECLPLVMNLLTPTPGACAHGIPYYVAPRLPIA